MTLTVNTAVLEMALSLADLVAAPFHGKESQLVAILTCRDTLAISLKVLRPVGHGPFDALVLQRLV